MIVALDLSVLWCKENKELSSCFFYFFLALWVKWKALDGTDESYSAWKEDAGPRRANLKGWCFIFLSKRIMGDFVHRHFWKPKKKRERKEAMVNQIWSGGECYIYFLLRSRTSCFTDRHYNIISHPENMQLICIWKRFSGEKTNQCNLYPVAARAHDEPPVETENGVKLWPLLPPSSLTNGSSDRKRPLWVSCNFRQPLAGVGDLSSSPPPSSSAEASACYLWPPSKVNVLPQVQINCTLTDQRPSPPPAPFHLNSHISYNRGN